MEAPNWRNFSASLVNASGADSFPIASFTWIYLPAKPSDTTRKAALGDLLGWIYSDGQAFADQEGYTALPPQLLAEVKKRLGDL